MKFINIYSEPFRRDGNISAEGASKLLGSPLLLKKISIKKTIFLSLFFVLFSMICFKVDIVPLPKI